MFILVCYDVETTSAHGRRRLRKVAKICESHGQRVQKSVFECKMEKELFLKFESKLLKWIKQDTDSLRFYILDENSVKKIKHYGIRNSVDFEAPLVL